MKLAPAIVSLLAAACAGRAPQVPDRLVVVQEEAPWPSAELVAAAQRSLAEHGIFDGAIDGRLGPATRVGLARFQRANDLKLTGTLDRETAAALGLVPGSGPAASPPLPGAPLLPGAVELLNDQERGALSQPPPDALAPALDKAATILAEVRAAAAEGLQRASMAGAGLPVEEESLGSVQARLASGRQAAFHVILEARRNGGWALLPPQLALRLEEELARRSLLLRQPDGRLGPDAEAAIRWVERSMGLPPTGQPSLALFEALEIDPSPMFVGSGERDR